MKYKDTIVNNVSDFLLWVKETYRVNVKGEDGSSLSFEHRHGYYRGQSCSSWHLIPSIFRYNPPINEHHLLAKANLALWNEVSSLKSYLGKIIYFQHFGLCSRLLDVTFNPLVALFMACCDENQFSQDGVVYNGCLMDAHNESIAELTAKYIFEYELQDMIIDFKEYADKEISNIKFFRNPIFIYPPINNPRIEAQNGAFIMAPLFENVIEEDKAFLNRRGLDDSGFFDERRAIIKAQNKDNMLQELSVLGYDIGTIFKGSGAKLKSIMIEEKWEANRYNLDI